jgi:hypothetical protein
MASAQSTPAPGPAPASAASPAPATPSAAADAAPAAAASTTAPTATTEPSQTAEPTANVEAAPAPAVAGTAASDTSAADKAAEELAAAALAEASAGSSSTPDPSEFSLSLYGFADFTYRYQFSSPFGKERPAFSVGNFNLYAGGELGDGWRTLTEVRFMYLPNGSVPMSQAFSPSGSYTDTTVGDYTDLSRPVRWGGISIQRVYVEHEFNSWFTLRAGQFLTPYGIWNVDHGSPTIIGIRRPYMVGQELIPNQQTGFELYGSGIVTGSLEVGYHLTLSNGRGPIDTFMDLDNNKAIGGRLFARHQSPLGRVTVGLSGYHGKYSARNFAASVDSKGNFVQTYPLTSQYDESSVAADVKWEKDGFLFQSEGAVHDVAYNERVRPAAFALSGPPGFTPDYREWGLYGITGYRFSFLGVMPWVGAEYFWFGKQSPMGADVAAVMGGLNVRPTARVALKAQYTNVWFPTDGAMPAPRGHINMVECQAAWSF